MPRQLRIRSFPLRLSEDHAIVIDTEEIRIANLGLTHEDSLRATVDGAYRRGKDEVDAIAVLEHLDLDYFSEHIPDELSDTRGHLTGMLEARGSRSAPRVDGRLSFRDTGFRVEALGTSFSIGASLDTAATVPEPVVDLRVTTDDFLLLDTASQRDRRFRGTLVADSDMRLTGNLDEPRALGSVGLRPGTALTVVLPDPDAALPGAEGVVRFTDASQGELADEAELDAQTVFRGVEVSADVRIDPASSLEVVVDPESGDRLAMHGGGEMNLGIDRAGTLSITGRYTIEEGTYFLSFYNLARREFRIVPGSGVVWSGDPFDAALEVQALYTVRAAVAPLLSGRSSADEDTASAGELPFHVVLTMEETLREPRTELSAGTSSVTRLGAYRLDQVQSSFGYTVRPAESLRHRLRPLEVAFVRPGEFSSEFETLLGENPALQRSLEEQFIIGGSYELSYRDDPSRQRRNRTAVTVDVDAAGNLLSTARAVPEGTYPDADDPGEVLGTPYSQFLRVDMDTRFFVPVAARSTLAARVLAGAGYPSANSSSLPRPFRFSVGGTSSLRAFRRATIGPGALPPESEGGPSAERTGDIRLETNLEYRFPVRGMLEGAVFADAGNIWALEGDGVCGSAPSCPHSCPRRYPRSSSSDSRE
ncbi:MAG: translocation/assembly module TamB domain-containing protein [Spirochaetaceae bacterium]